jgi:flagellar hook assembly protein FlgD
MNDLPSSVPVRTETGQNYPNPFQTGTTIPYQLFEPSHVQLTIHNYLGQQVTTLVNEFQYEGKYSVYWNAQNSEGRQLGSGLYLYRLITENNTVSVGKLLKENNVSVSN